MVIAVNTRFLLPGVLEGIGTFSYEILKRMVRNHPEIEFIFIFDREFDQKFVFAENVKPVVIGPPARHPVLWKVWFDYQLPRYLNKLKPDVFLSLDGYTSPRAKCKKVTVFHDLAFEHFPKYTPGNVAKFYKKNTPQYARASDKCVVVSEFVKNDFVETYGMDSSKFEVVYNACSEFPENKTLKLPGGLERLLEGHKYFVYLGAIHPRKNVLGMLKAYEYFRNHNFRDIKFVIAGRDAWGNSELMNYYQEMNFKNDVYFIGTIKDEKFAILKNAEALIYCSKFEGFGIPIVEAQSVGCPVITSDEASMPEVGGEGALYADPFSVNSIAEQMGKLVNEPGLRSKLIAAGYENAKRFSWDDSSKKLFEILQNA